MNKNEVALLSQQLLETEDQDEVNRIIGEFNVFLKKKEALRAQTYSNLQDKVTDEITQRLENRSGEFSNKELLDYLTTFDNVVSKNKIDKIETPQIAIQTNINVEGSVIDTESRQRIQRYIQNILSEQEIETIDDTTNN